MHLAYGLNIYPLRPDSANCTLLRFLILCYLNVLFTKFLICSFSYELYLSVFRRRMPHL